MTHCTEPALAPTFERMRSYLVPLFCLALLPATAQEPCAAQELTEAHLGRAFSHQEIRDAVVEQGVHLHFRGNVAVIPVVVHVVWNDPSENVPDVTILAMLDQLNADFGATNSDLVNVRPTFSASVGNAAMEFCLATVDPNGNATTGITRTMTTETWFDPDVETNDMKSAPKGSPAWDPDQYLNIWICDISSGATGGNFTLGYAFLPVAGIPGSAIDGLVLDATYGLGPGNRTATHEIGHYFGLLHPFALGSCADADGFADTPPTDSPTFSCANNSLMKCGMLTQYENFMDYASCSILFTAEQVAEMNDVLVTLRPGLLMGGICANGAMPNADFIANTTNILAGQTIDLTDLSTNTPTQWAWDLPGATPSSSVDQDPVGVLYPVPGCYTVTLTASNAFGSDQEARPCYVDVAINTSMASVEGTVPEFIRNGNVLSIQWPGKNGPWNLILYDATGRVLQHRVQCSGLQQVPTDELTRGLYLIGLSDASERAVMRFVLP